MLEEEGEDRRPKQGMGGNSQESVGRRRRWPMRGIRAGAQHVAAGDPSVCSRLLSSWGRGTHEFRGTGGLSTPPLRGPVVPPRKEHGRRRQAREGTRRVVYGEPCPRSASEGGTGKEEKARSDGEDGGQAVEGCPGQEKVLSWL